MVKSCIIGSVELSYLKERKTDDDSSFLRKERLLINDVANRIGNAYKRISAQKQIEVERNALKDMNITLRETINSVHEEKKRNRNANQDKCG